MILPAKWKLRQEIGHTGRIPRGWRMAWYEPQRRIGVYYPFPLDRVFRAAHQLAYRIALAWWAPDFERAEVLEMQRTDRQRVRLADEYARGYLNGWHECYQECLVAVEEELSRSDELWDTAGLLLDPPKLPPAN